MSLTPEQQRPDQPAPDFEEARRRRAELVIEDIDAAEAKGNLSAHQRECRGVARDFLALLSEREAREEVVEAARALMYEPVLAGEPEDAGQVRLLEALAALPATESAQAEGER